jgi:hypothetical protein
VFLAVVTSKQSDDASSDAALVQQLLRRDMRAFEQLYDRHSRIVYGLFFCSFGATPVSISPGAGPLFPGCSPWPVTARSITCA